MRRSLLAWKASLPMAVVGVLLAAVPARGQVSLEILGGTSFSADSRLTIRQDGQPDLAFTAHWSTRPLDDAPYYAVRLGLWKGRRGWLLENVHHKVYLDNPPPEVGYFHVTFGYNLFVLSRGWKVGHFVLSAGAGPVLTHEVSEVRGRRFENNDGILGLGYSLNGATVLGGVQYRVDLGQGAYLALDTKVSASWVNVKVAGGDATVPNAALHLLGGLGVEF